MPSTVEKLGPSRVKLTIEIPFSDLKPHLDKAYREIAQSVNIPGFRRGKVPPAVIDQRFGRGAVLQDAINEALPEAYGKAVEEAKIVPLAEPEIDVTKLEDRELVEFTAEVDVRPEFDLPDFSTLSATVDPVADREKEIDERIEVMRQRFATRTEVERAAKKGDVVTIDITASQDGQEIEDAKAEGISYKVGAAGMLDGLDKAVTGKKAGDEADFTSTLVGGPKKDEKADIHIVVQKVQEEKLPEVDDDFAQMISEFDTVGEMREDLGTAVDRMGRAEQLQDASDKVLEDLLTKVDFEVPKTLVDAQVQARTDQINQQLAQAGLTLEGYLADSDEEADTEEEFWAEVAKNTENGLKAQIILDKLADDDEIGVDQAELTEMLFRRAAQSGSSPEQEMQHMMEHNHTAEWMQEIRRTKALQKIVAAATVKDTSGAVVNVAAIRPDGSLDEGAEDAEAEAPAAEKPTKKAPAKKAAKDEAEPAASDEKAADEKPAKKAPAKKAAQDDSAE